jgi:hypothetical protein
MSIERSSFENNVNDSSNWRRIAPSQESEAPVVQIEKPMSDIKSCETETRFVNATGRGEECLSMS